MGFLQPCEVEYQAGAMVDVAALTWVSAPRQRRWNRQTFVRDPSSLRRQAHPG